jgi:SAM-dependent methyltransferase
MPTAAVTTNAVPTPAAPTGPPASGTTAPVPGAVLYQTTLSYETRADKARYIAGKYASILRGSVLDVGCGEAPLRALVGSPGRYLGVDIDGQHADIALDLDDAVRRRRGLPVEDRSFDTVVCTDVLEHLEHAHEVFDELCRVARDRVIVSLPNPLLSLLLGLVAGSHGRMKFYGLPLDPPQDRHRWFFSYDEAVNFVTQRAGRHGFFPEQIDAENRAVVSWRTPDGRELLDGPAIRNGTMWGVLRRSESA